MKLYKRIFDEGINDKYIFKAVFLAGGPGAGKSYISSLIFGVDKDTYTSPFGVKVINSDTFFENKFRKFNLPFVLDMSNTDVYERQMELRDIAKNLTASTTGYYIDGMLPLIIDGTGRDYEKIKNQAEVLQEFGYDTSMVFVNTSLEVALQRNASRERQVDSELVKKMWLNVQKNIGSFQKYFTQNNFIIIDSNKHISEGTPEGKKFSDELFRIGKKLLEAPLKNIIGKRVIANLLETNGKYLHDLNIKIKNGFKI